MSVHHLFNQKLLTKYNTSGPRYTSYPTALEFNQTFQDDDLVQAITRSNSSELSLYLHIPFCHSLCYYCGCNKIVTRHREKADIYLDYLIKEIQSRSALCQSYQVTQLHLGGGTPSFLTNEQMSRLMSALRQAFNFADQVEISIEVDPREIELSMLDHLTTLGFNRLSIGVQDTDVKVQTAINRVQSTSFIADLVARAKTLNFKSVNVDLIYGLPHQNRQTFEKTLNDVNAMDVDRISLFSYAHLPNRFAAQRKLRDEWLPSSAEKFSLMQLAVEQLSAWGYELIGMDHFAKADDELAVAQKEGKLHRNFQGYTTKGNCDLLGLGVSSISAIGDCYSQNQKELKAYYQQIDNLGHAVDKGVVLSKDDIIRGHVIRELMCNLFVDKQKISEDYQIDFDDYFKAELLSLDTFIQDDLVATSENWISVAPRARLFIRNIAMSFDAYMKNHINQQRFSRVI